MKRGRQGERDLNRFHNSYPGGLLHDCPVLVWLGAQLAQRPQQAGE